MTQRRYQRNRVAAAKIGNSLQIANRLDSLTESASCFSQILRESTYASKVPPLPSKPPLKTNGGYLGLYPKSYS